MNTLNLLGIDFEEWYHPELIQPYIKNQKTVPKIIAGIDKILNLLRENDTLATFFVVGELLEHTPELLDKIIDNGHEVGFHTMHHTNLNHNGFKDDFDFEVKKFAELTGKKSRGFRAPTFSLNSSSSWAIDILEKNNYLYDSSIVPAKTRMYGNPGAEQKPYNITSKSLEKNDPNGKLKEFPLLTTKFLGKKILAAGGFYLRSLPFNISINAIKNAEKHEYPACLYIHSWELTPEFMPRVKMSFKDDFVTYHNIEKSYSRIEKILKSFKFTSYANFDF